ncbi:RDD family protein [Tenacibaculum sp. 47A_GOM-205m]|uniref:RDD family protein n=1 Tax=Tenacibaculum sp. 47A_GOM-205m TaxID=1380384 RepID=UPI0004B04531|nr:RDD family protein [Tenacibaculum sp. 47A_GOM-205m]
MNDLPFEILAFGGLLLLYLALYYLSEWIIKIELKKKKTNRISNAKTYKTITRRGEKYDYEFPLNPNIDGFWIRLFAKLFDYGIYLGIFYLIDRYLTEIKLYPFLVAFFALFVINPIFESLTGRTFGKYIFGMRVIDDFGGNPSFLTSFIKNLLQLFSIAFYILSSATILEDEMFFHNKRTFTYTIWNKDKEKILSELNN